MNHPRLGRLTHSDGHLHGSITLPRFAEYGGVVREPSIHFPILIDDPSGSGATSEQLRAIDHLLESEESIRELIWEALEPVLINFDLRSEVAVWDIEVSRLHLHGVAYLGFRIDVDGDLENGLSVVYHPTQGTFIGDEDGLSAIQVADNLY